jgi:transcription elongation GreA/GreB family factor
MLKEKDITLNTITPLTPIGKVLIGKQVGEEIEIRFPKPRTIVIKEVL